VRLGLSSYCYVWSIGQRGYPMPDKPMTPFDLVDQAAAHGVGLVQIADNLPIEGLSTAERQRLLAHATDRKVEIELGTRGISQEHLESYLELARSLSSTLLRVVMDTKTHHPDPAEAVKMLRAVAPTFERAGVRIAIENHDRFRAAQLLQIVEQIDSKAVGVCLDTANSLGCAEGPELVVDTLGPAVINLHLKDFVIARLPHGKGFVVEGRAAGEGQLDIPRVLKRLKDFGRDPNAIIELWTPPEADSAATIEKERAWVSSSVRFLRPMIAG
jgi:3-oxoisoapionate decarboxylase